MERLPKNSSSVIDAMDIYGNTPLHLAFLTANIDVLRELIQKRPNINLQNKDEMTPIDYGLSS